MRKILVAILTVFTSVAHSEPPFLEPLDTNVLSMPPIEINGTTDVNITNNSSSPIPVTVQNSGQSIVEYRYVGLTAYEDDGNFTYEGLIGIAAMNKVCSTSFGAGARAATVSEAYFRDDTDTRDGWLVPGSSPITVFKSEQSTPTFSAFDAVTGQRLGGNEEYEILAQAKVYCGRYTASENGDGMYEGLVITPIGKVSHLECTTVHPVACSAPVAIPVQ